MSAKIKLRGIPVTSDSDRCCLRVLSQSQPASLLSFALDQLFFFFFLCFFFLFSFFLPSITFSDLFPLSH
jgi:hypothetical protein